MGTAIRRRRRKTVAFALLAAAAATQSARGEDAAAARLWMPSPQSASFPGTWQPGQQTIAFTDGWSAFADGYRLRAHTKTDNVFADGNYTSQGYVAGFAKRITPHLTFGVRFQNGDTAVAYQQLPGHSLTTSSRAVAFDVIVEDEHVVWRSTASTARDDFSLTDPFAPAVWNGLERAFDSQFNLRFTVSRLTVSPFVGFRRLELQQNAFSSIPIFGFSIASPEQTRNSTQVRGGLDLQLEILTLGRYATLLGHVSGRVEAEGTRQPPIATAAELTGMAGNSFTFDFPFNEPSRFPGDISYVTEAGLELRAAEFLGMFVNVTDGENPMLHWHAVEGGVRVLF